MYNSLLFPFFAFSCCLLSPILFLTSSLYENLAFLSVKMDTKYYLIPCERYDIVQGAPLAPNQELHRQIYLLGEDLAEIATRFTMRYGDVIDNQDHRWYKETSPFLGVILYKD
ncbi:uncharacterized protein LOC111304856 isoform X2 [Durio zibethinus]|uniref:Uncharacterized protein LOC111304856 isoform X2 n=1 Tax=Durio zibethinus TaxID=66656 RepID=A0A6P5ZYJ9_DURZI|nr:uncharacterized protein LOC111304856 isoform X2 [Durio zibethinus]